jgi:hypothetical protein
MNTQQLSDLVSAGEIDEGEVLDVLRNPYCTPEIAETIAKQPGWMTSQVVRERLTGFRGLSLTRAMALLPTLPWPSLLQLAQIPSTPPVVKRHAERRLLNRLNRMTLGEKIALARRAHRPLFIPLIQSGDTQILVALLDNGRLVENDVLVILNSKDPPLEFFRELLSHHRWGQAYEVKRTLVQSSCAPLPLALSAMVQLRRGHLREIVSRETVPEPVREAARKLLEREGRESDTD